MKVQKLNEIYGVRETSGEWVDEAIIEKEKGKK